LSTNAKNAVTTTPSTGAAKAAIPTGTRELPGSLGVTATFLSVTLRLKCQQDFLSTHKGYKTKGKVKKKR
jgi:hypothetical protein